MQGKSFLSITYLLAILHAAHTARCSTLHPHRISLRSIALSRIGASLLGSRPRGGPLLLLGVGVGPSIWLPTHLPNLVHWAWRLEDTEKECLNELKRWMDGLETLDSVITNSNKFYNDATDCSDFRSVTGKRREKT